MRRPLSRAEERWVNLWARLGVINKEWVSRQYRIMLKHYSERHRYYHVFIHIEYGFALLDEYRHLAENFDAVELAWFLHDIIYRTKKKSPSALSDEERSANYSNRVIWYAGLADDFRFTVLELILASVRDPNATLTRDQMLLVDIDWSVLGLPWEVYRVYVAKVRREYPQYTDEEFRIGRAKWVRMNQRERHFYLDEFNWRFNVQAQQNLAYELSRYQKGDFAKLWELR